MASNLDKIEHVVVLMMENRSFDHLLGYLELNHVLPVDGLSGTESNPDLNGLPVLVNRLSSTLFPTDVGHSSVDVRTQLQNGNQGFVVNYLNQAKHAAGSMVMGYHDATHVWAYDQLARSFAVCDHWHSALPGPTIPNRLFAVAGQSDGDTDQPPHGIKIYTGVRSVFDCLDAALQAVPKKDRWGYFFHDLPLLGLLEQHITEILPLGPHRIRKIGNFFDRARAGTLPAVSWIDPNYADVGSSNDDHPPKSDLYDGQSLVTSIYHALLDGANQLWQKTLFIVTYDEHGGFFDHVIPPASGDTAPFERFGARVPTLAMSPWIPAQVDSVVRSHASILRTILDRFAPGEHLTPRVNRAESLAALLSLSSPRSDSPRIAVPPRPAAKAARAAAQAEPGNLDPLLEAYRAELKRRGVVLDPQRKLAHPRAKTGVTRGKPAGKQRAATARAVKPRKQRRPSPKIRRRRRP